MKINIFLPNLLFISRDQGDFLRDSFLLGAPISHVFNCTTGWPDA